MCDSSAKVFHTIVTALLGYLNLLILFQVAGRDCSIRVSQFFPCITPVLQQLFFQNFTHFVVFCSLL